jgi:hypothetical protein
MLKTLPRDGPPFASIEMPKRGGDVRRRLDGEPIWEFIEEGLDRFRRPDGLKFAMYRVGDEDPIEQLGQ